MHKTIALETNIQNWDHELHEYKKLLEAFKVLARWGRETGNPASNLFLRTDTLPLCVVHTSGLMSYLSLYSEAPEATWGGGGSFERHFIILRTSADLTFILLQLVKSWAKLLRHTLLNLKQARIFWGVRGGAHPPRNFWHPSRGV